MDLNFFTPLFKLVYPQLIWDKPAKHNSKTIYLSFDDGPIPELTPWIISILKKYNIKATFFCVGNNIQKNPTIFKSLLEEGHKIGNHTFYHQVGWKISTTQYLQDIEKCQLEINKYDSSNTLTNANIKMLFRPPHGKIAKSQIKALKDRYDIIMWSNLTRDYQRSLSPEKCFANAIKNTKNGSIIVFHDNIKATQNIKYTLEKYIQWALSNNYKFATL